MSRDRKRRGGARAIWLKVHLYLGLVAGAVLAVLGVTGSILVFEHGIDRLLNPEIAVSSTGAERISPDAVLAGVESRYGLRPYYIEAPTEGGPYVAFIADSGSASGVRAIVFDPGEGQVLASRSWAGYFTSFVRELHTNLFLGAAGTYIVAAVSILALVSILTGVYLWWPRPGMLRRALTFNWRRHAPTLNFEIHRVSGFYLGVAMFVISLSGTYLALPEPVTAAVDAVADTSPWPSEVASVPPAPNAAPLSLSEVAQVVEQHTPGAAITGYQLPGDPIQAYAVYYRDPAEPYSRYGRSSLWIDQYTGGVLAARPYLEGGAGDQFLLSQVLLHNGQMLGLFGRWLVFVAGIAIPVMYGTGFYLWWKRRGRARQAVARKAGMVTT